MLQTNAHRRAIGARWLPGDMKYDISIGRICRMGVLLPSRGNNIYLDIACDGRLVSDLDDCLAKVGARLLVPKAGVKNSDGPSIHRLEALLNEALVSPHLLEQCLGRGLFRLFRQAEKSQSFRAISQK